MIIKKFYYNKIPLIAELNSAADESVWNEIFIEKEYRLLEEIIKKASLPIIDIGAHIGLFCLYVRALNPNARIHAYEPGTENFQTLKKNLLRNHFEKNIIAKNLAVAANGGPRSLYISLDSHNHSLINYQKTAVIEKISAISLPKILEKTGPVDLVKMDCEGAEFEILPSLSKDDFSKIKSLYLEYHEYAEDLHFGDLQKILQKNFSRIQVHPSHYDRRMGFILACA